MKIEIIPAILPKDFSELDEQIGLVKAIVKTIQIDVCDGQFVPTATWPYKRLDDSFEKILREEEGLPGWENVSFEIDLMVNYPERIVDEWVTAGAHRIILHAEAKGDVIGAINSLEGRVETCLAFGLDDSKDPIGYLSDFFHSGYEVDAIQVMGIANIGSQGQPFDPRVLELIKDLKVPYPNLPISVDGGVSLETAQLLIEAGATRLVVGSAIFRADNPIDAVQKFKKLAHQ